MKIDSFKQKSGRKIKYVWHLPTHPENRALHSTCGNPATSPPRSEEDTHTLCDTEHLERPASAKWVRVVWRSLESAKQSTRDVHLSFASHGMHHFLSTSFNFKACKHSSTITFRQICQVPSRPESETSTSLSVPLFCFQMHQWNNMLQNSPEF